MTITFLEPSKDKAHIHVSPTNRQTEAAIAPHYNQDNQVSLEPISLRLPNSITDRLTTNQLTGSISFT